MDSCVAIVNFDHNHYGWANNIELTIMVYNVQQETTQPENISAKWLELKKQRRLY